MNLFTSKKSNQKWMVLPRALFAAVFLIVPGVSEIKAQSFTQPLFIPDTLSTLDHDTILLVAQETQRIFFPGATTEVVPGHGVFAGDAMPVMTMSYTNPTTNNPGILGPTLVWWKGDSVTMAVDNQLMDSTTTHWHGAHVAAYNDGGPHQGIAPGTVWQPSFKIRDDATTMWYHPHLHMMTMMQVNMGMAGLIIIKDSNDVNASQLPHTYGVDEFPIILQDKYFGQDFNMMMDTIDTKCSMGTNFLVNGVWQPVVDVPAQLNRFRILNGSSERSYCLFLRDSSLHEWVPFHVIASDAGYLNAPVLMGTPPVIQGNLDSLLIMMSGERYEIVFDGAGRLGDTLYLMNNRNMMLGNTQVASFAGGPNLNDPPCYSALYTQGGMIPDSSFDSTSVALMRIIVGPANGNPGTMPGSLVNNSVPSPIDVVRTKTLYSINTDPNAPPFSIDLTNFEMSFVNDTVFLNDTEEWDVYNISGVAHPFHIHDIHFYITSINGSISNVPLYMQGPKDVAPVTDDSRFSLVMKFTDFATSIAADSCYMYHCHILAHEDGGMMHQFVVTPHSNVGIAPEAQAPDWSVYPNPASSTISVERNNTETGVLRLYDMSGNLVKEFKLNEQSNVTILDISDLAGGMYLLEMEQESGVTVQRVSVIH